MTTPNRPPLSPAAQAVLKAAYNAVWPWEIPKAQQADAREIAAAALRAAADQVVPDSEKTPWGSTVQVAKPLLHVHRALLAIAAELEGHG